MKQISTRPTSVKYFPEHHERSSPRDNHATCTNKRYIALHHLAFSSCVDHNHDYTLNLELFLERVPEIVLAVLGGRPPRLHFAPFLLLHQLIGFHPIEHTSSASISRHTSSKIQCGSDMSYDSSPAVTQQWPYILGMSASALSVPMRAPRGWRYFLDSYPLGVPPAYK